ncbi:MAG: hypothetical protein IJB54_01435 [Firmicutes bacterium]|nr:hypothetical protein [Bacillota bacterium]
MMASNPSLKYKISSWKQLPKCLSNKSKYLHIRVGEYTTEELSGTRIVVEHEILGTLFACLVNAHGQLLSKNDEGVIFELTPGQILQELEKFGFLIVYNPISELSGNQIEFLMTINKLKYDKIRILSVWNIEHGEKQFKEYVVAFLAKDNPQWLNASYAPSYTEFVAAVSNGSAFNVSSLSECSNYNWSWLHNFVANIDDVINDYANSSKSMEVLS